MTVSFSVAAEAVISLLLLIAVGFYAARGGVIDERMSKKLSALVVNIAQPFMLVNALINVSYSPENVKKGLSILGLSLVSHVILALLAFFTAKYQKDPSERKITEYSIIFCNCAFIGFPILSALFGDMGLFLGAFYVVGFNLSVWSYGMLLFSRGRGDIQMNFRKMLLNHGTTPCVIGVILYLLRISFPTPVANAFSHMSSLCTPIVLLVIGANLSRLPLKSVFTNPRLYACCALKLFVAPVLIALIYHFAGLPRDYVVFLTVMAALPTAAMAVMFAELYDERPDLASQTVGMSTLLSMFTIPVVAVICNLILKL